MRVSTLLHAAVVRRATRSCSGAGRRLGERVASIDALFGTEAHPGAGAGADVGRRFRQSREVLRLGGRHREAHRRHGGSLGERGGWTGGGVAREPRARSVEREGEGRVVEE